ncbi:C6 domain protein, partial [Necator americanus]
MQPIPASSMNPTETNGMLTLDHFSDFNGCRVVVIRCSVAPRSENATIIFNDGIDSLSSSSRITTSLTCNEEGKWIRMNQEITSAACRVS